MAGVPGSVVAVPMAAPVDLAFGLSSACTACVPLPTHQTRYFSTPDEVTSAIAGLNDARDVLAPHMPGMPGYVSTAWVLMLARSYPVYN